MTKTQWAEGTEPREAKTASAGTCADGRYRPIADYAVVGNTQSAALITSDGSVDWLCLPHFDSPAILCRILDADKGGFLSLQPARPITRSLRRYRDASNVLETYLETDTGCLTLTDAMPLAADHPNLRPDGVWSGHGRHSVIRHMRATGGPVEVALRARLSFDFAQTPALLTLVPGKGALIGDAGTDGRHLALVWPGELTRNDDGELRGSLRLAEGDEAACVLAYETDPALARQLLDGADWRAIVLDADRAWRDWAACCHPNGPYRDALLRSALTLKLLTFAPTGAILAAPTTSLPEVIGGVRNWDYRYCWLRDATFTLYALVLAGDQTTARAFSDWIEHTCADDPPADVRIMYSIHGGTDIVERNLDNLAGYCDSRPVRVGNDAVCQNQLDVFGEVLDAFWFAYEHLHNGRHYDISPKLWHWLRGIADYICLIWRRKDCGIWEMRTHPRDFVYSKTMCWVGLDRAIRLANAVQRDGDVARWTTERDAIRAEILARGYNERVGAFTMAYDSDALDAATLRMLLVGFLPASDPRMRSTVKQIQRHLMVDGLLLRYRADQVGDGFPGHEGAFTMCTFWLVDCLCAIGEIQEAKTLFEHLLGYANDLGLYAEEIDAKTGAALGNFPQAFTHLALIDAGLDLTEALASNIPVPSATSERAHAVRRGRKARGEQPESGQQA